MSLGRTTAFLSFSAALLIASLAACQDKPPEPEPPAKPSKPTVPDQAPAAPKKDLSPSGQKGPDPMGGKFTLAQATAGMPEGTDLIATIDTDKGVLSCELFDDKAPVTVANFVGLARGLRPFKDKGSWVKRPAYDGLSFHRVIKGFMIQGGDPTGSGAGDPGYVIPDELWDGAKHDRRGLLCMANRGPNTNGMQFFITDAAAPHLDRGYTIFGHCSPDKVVEALASVPVRGSRPQTPLKIKKVTISR